MLPSSAICYLLLLQDYWRLKDALLLLGEAPTVPTSTTSSPGAAKSPSPSLAKISISSTIAPLTCSPGSPHHRPKSPVKAALEAAVDDARREVAAAAVHVVEAIEEEVLQKKLRYIKHTRAQGGGEGWARLGVVQMTGLEGRDSTCCCGVYQLQKL